jgi:hypothetical protein
MDFPPLSPKEAARDIRVTRATVLVAIGGFLIVSYFHFNWVRVAPSRVTGPDPTWIGLDLASHPTLFSGYNLGAWPTLVFAAILFGSGIASFIRPGRTLAWTSFSSSLLISADVFYQGIAASPKVHGVPKADQTFAGGAFGILVVALISLIISWYYVRRYRSRRQLTGR